MSNHKLRRDVLYQREEELLGQKKKKKSNKLTETDNIFAYFDRE